MSSKENEDKTIDMVEETTGQRVLDDQSLYRLMFDYAPGGIGLVTLDGDVLLHNRKLAELFGYEYGATTTKRVFEFYRNPDDRMRMLELLASEARVEGMEAELVRRDGSFFWGSISILPVRYEGQHSLLAMISDITRKKKDEEALKLDEVRFQVLYNLSQMIGEPEEEILDYALEAGVQMTSSDIGYIYFLNSDETELTLHAWSRSVMPQCEVEDYPEAYKVSQTGLWGEAVRRREAVITNDYEGSPLKKGYPKGHVPVKRHMNLPVFEDGRMVLLAGVGNKVEEYTDKDVRQLALIMEGMWSILQRNRAEHELLKARSELENRVRERTQQLAMANARLKSEVERRRLAQMSLKLYERIVSSTPDLVSLVDQDDVYRVVNESYLRYFDMDSEDIIGKSVKDLVGQDFYESVSRPNLDRARAGELVETESWIDFPKLGRRYLAVAYHPVDDENNKDCVAVDARDITRLKQAEDDRQRIFDVSLDMICIVDFNGRFLDVNPACETILGFTVEEMKSTTWDGLALDEDKEETLEVIDRLKRGESVSGFRSRYRRKDGKSCWLACSCYPDMDRREIVTVARDVTKRKAMEDELRRLATTDPLTGADNRRSFLEQAGTELRRAGRYGQHPAMLALDVDHFKAINDRYGHDAGDEVLKKLVRVCRESLRTTDFFGRLGGEEFNALLVQTGLVEALNTAERLRQTIENTVVGTSAGDISFTVSIGVATSDGEDTLEHLLKRADTALYAAKKGGRNKVLAG